MGTTAQKIAIVSHYFPPLNSSGAKRMEAMAKYWARAGRKVVVITTTKTTSQGVLTEPYPEGVEVHELTRFGRLRNSPSPVPFDRIKHAGRGKQMRNVKDFVMRWCGQIPEPRLPFAFGFLNPFCSREVEAALEDADIIVATSPPWSILLAAVFAKWRWGTPVVLDYRDQFSKCHELPGSKFAKAVEVEIDGFLNQHAEAVVTISDPMSDYYRGFHTNVFTILNGYDAEQIESAKQRSPWHPRAPGSPLTLRYLGNVSLGRIPRHLLAAMRALSAEGKLERGSLRVEYYGNWQQMEQVLANEYADLQDYFALLPQVSYARSLELICSADHLLFCENSIPARPGEEKSAAGILTTKLFEYLASGRPILADISPKALAGSFARNASETHFVSDRTPEFAYYMRSKTFWNPEPCAVSPFVETLSRSAQAAEYLRRLDTLVAARIEQTAPAPHDPKPDFFGSV